MKVLQIANNYPINKLYGLLFEKLEQNRVDNYVYCPLNYRDTISEVLTEHIVLKKNFNTLDRFLFYTKQKKMIQDIEKYFEVSSFDVIHAHTLFSGGYSAYKLSQRYGIPYMVAVRNTDVNTFFKYMWHLRGIGVKTMRKASAIIFLSQAYRDMVIGKYVPATYTEEILKKSYIIPNGIDDFWHENKYLERRDVSHNSNEIKLVYAGMIDANKNIGATQMAMDILDEQGMKAHLTVIGPVSDRNVYGRLCIDKRTTFVSALPKEELIKFYRMNDIFVMPSFAETFGLVYAEAMSQGLPVLYSEGQGFDGQFAEGEVGYHVDSHDPVDIAEKIKLVCQNYATLSSNGTKLVSKFKWGDIAKRYVSIYQLSRKN